MAAALQMAWALASCMVLLGGGDGSNKMREPWDGTVRRVWRVADAATPVSVLATSAIHDRHFRSRATEQLDIKLVALRKQAEIKVFIRNSHYHACRRHRAYSIIAIRKHSPNAFKSRCSGRVCCVIASDAHHGCIT